MKDLLIFLTMVFVGFVSKAENYPYRSDCLFLTTPDHADWLYEVGEEPEIEVIFQQYGMPKTIECEYSVADDMMKHTDYKSITLKDGRGIIKIPSRKTPGFRDLQLCTQVGGQNVSHHIKVGFSVDKIEPWTQEPTDFIEFWDGVLAEQAKLPLKYTIESAPEYTTDKFDCKLVKLKMLDGHAMYGYLFIPAETKQGKKCPVVLCPPGAGIKTIKEPLRHRYYADNGMIRFEIEIHGLDPRLPESTFKDISNAFNGRNCGYLENGIENPDRYYMRHVYAGLVRCIDFLCSLPEWDGENCIVQGGSQGGALSIVCAALDPRVTQCVVNHPALADMGAYSEPGRTGGYPHFCNSKVEYTPATLHTMALYDVVNFARHVKCPTFMTWGYNDNTCPPTTSYGVWNILTCPKESLITPINEHWTSEQTERNHLSWILNHLH